MLSLSIVTLRSDTRTGPREGRWSSCRSAGESWLTWCAITSFRWRGIARRSKGASLSGYPADAESVVRSRALTWARAPAGERWRYAVSKGTRAHDRTKLQEPPTNRAHVSRRIVCPPGPNAGSFVNLFQSLGDHQRLYSASLIVALTLAAL